MAYSRRTRGQFLYICLLMAFGVFVLAREVRDDHRNSARLVDFRADSACVAPLASARPMQSPLCHDESAEVTARWSRTRYKSRSRDYYLALRLPDGFVDSLRLVGDSAVWAAAAPRTTFFVRQFAAKDWSHPRVIALVGNGVAAQTSKHPIWRGNHPEFLIRGGAIVGLGTILLIILAVHGREDTPDEARAPARAA